MTKSHHREDFTLEQHKATGDELYAMRDRLIDRYLTLCRQYGKSAAVAKAAKRALDHVDQLRSLLDDVVGEENPGRSLNKINEPYYRP